MMLNTSLKKMNSTLMMAALCVFFYAFDAIASETFKTNIYFDGNIVTDPGMCYFNVEGLNPGPGDALSGLVENDNVYNYNFGEVVFRSYNGRYILDRKYRKNFNVEFTCTGELALESYMLVQVYPVYGTVKGQKNSVMSLLSLPLFKYVKSLGLQLLFNGNPVTTQRPHWMRVGKNTGMAFQLIQLDPYGADLEDNMSLFAVVNVIVQPN
ncbi:hypothetical protein RAC65_07915 [Pantoea sp. BS_8]|uniref:hypothetical protein n=1 Tax=Pantoea TaxID=53335 RepID=UPI000A881876|nr:hypothetical protein [Pantoea stewartii]